MVIDGRREMENSQKAINLFSFIKGLNEIRRVTITDIAKQLESFYLKDFPNNEEYIQIFDRDRRDEDDSDDNMTLLQVKKPIFEPCPAPDSSLLPWLKDGWNDFKKSSDYFEEKQENKIFGNSKIEKFADNPSREQRYKEWLDKRNLWAEKQKKLDQINSLFKSLVLQHINLQANSETEEMIVANGFLLDRDNNEICHPILSRRVKTSFDEENNIVSIVDTDNSSELYIPLLREIQDFNQGQINSLNTILMEQDYHPLDNVDTPKYLKSVIHSMSTDSVFSNTGVPKDWKLNYRFLMYTNPVFIVRKKMDGSVKAIESIIDNIRKTGFVPNHLLDIINGGEVELPEDIPDETIEQKLAFAGGEDPDILLSKEANREQLEIAERIEKYNAVLVQGPPGTGKTHTIANLLGHFLAEGKSVLITSHTSKALSVLKEKIDPDIRDLCVSVLDESNQDMEKSIDGITEHMAVGSSYYRRQMEIKSTQRKEIIKELAETRKAVYKLINQEYESIVIDGVGISPSDAAKFVTENQELNYIPGKIKMYAPLPLTFDELIQLYKTNEDVTLGEETELDTNLPDPKELVAPSLFSDCWKKKNAVEKYIHTIEEKTKWIIEAKGFDDSISFETPFGRYETRNISQEMIDQFYSEFSDYKNNESWMLSAAIDGIKGGVYKNRWNTLTDQIKHTIEVSDQYISVSYGHRIDVGTFEFSTEGENALQKIRSKFSEGKKIGWFDRKMSKEVDLALNQITIDEKSLSSVEDIDLILLKYELDTQRRKCAAFWDDLVKANGGLSFKELDIEDPEHVALRWATVYEKYLNWYESDYLKLVDIIRTIGFDDKTIFEVTPFDSERVQIEKQLHVVNVTLPIIFNCVRAKKEVKEINNAFNRQSQILQKENRVNSNICLSLLQATNSGNEAKYTQCYGKIVELYNKYSALHKRRELLSKLDPVAHEWAEAIRKREGTHGLNTVPNSIENAWKWKQYSEILSEMLQEPYDELQKKSNSLSKEYRKITAEYAENCAWYHLLRRTESNKTMQQSLIGWKQTVKKIGKGTGKNAPKLKAEAKKLMAECQRAVPAWIMTVNKALDSLDPRQNRFDIIIIDEASQSDLSSMAILYMAEKIIVVGDDKQVSPMAVGVQSDQIKNLVDEYLKDIMHISHLFDAKTSIYDIAATTFQPLMLTEHFRCVPEIINYSNMLSYDWKIKPLRDASTSRLLPATVNYRVDGYCDRKTNLAEADAIVALIQACIQQPEYDGKTFGVISMVGEEQAQMISRKLFDVLGPKTYQNRKILCGNSANFQGDERDVIFLSLVDSNENEGPLRMRNEGSDDANKKRYNVAVSRAKDQLWVVNSLDSSNDLKAGDLRKGLIEYAKNPKAFEYRHKEIEQEADSPFESEVVSYLVQKGYNVTQQWPVGSYRLDMVVQSGNNKAAIECDGERYHGPDKTAADMERQTILERIGWRFIRLRGSEYYSNKKAAMNRILSNLMALGIIPESGEQIEEAQSTNLLERVKQCASTILADAEYFESQSETIANALNSKE